MQINLSYLPNIVSKHFFPLLSNKKKFLILYGGISSGKSVFICQKLIYRILTDGIQHRILVVRKVGDKLRQSVFAEFISVLKDMGLSAHAKITTTPMEIELFGSKILFSGIDDSEKIKSISRISAIWVEEATELEEGDFDELVDRLRTDYPTYKQIMMSFNPISINHWIYKKFFEGDDLKSDTHINKSTYLNNDFINRKEFGDGIKKLYKNKPNSYQVKVLGNFGNDKLGGEFYSSFNAGENTSDLLRYDPELPLILSFDFNVLPFSACIVGQIHSDGDRKQLNIIHEFALEHPNNRPIHVIEKFKVMFPHHYSGIYVTGDASGKNNSTRTEAGVNDYTPILDGLKHYVGVKDMVPSKNPNVFQRGEFINSIFDNQVENATVLINSTCEKLIEDLSNIKRQADGTKQKKKVKDKITGSSIEQYGHMSDALDIMITTFFKNDFKKYMKGGETTLHVGEAYVSNNLY